MFIRFFFFFSSRRRHTRFSRDWSSDVCSSDLFKVQKFNVQGPERLHTLSLEHRTLKTFRGSPFALKNFPRNIFRRKLDAARISDRAVAHVVADEHFGELNADGLSIENRNPRLRLDFLAANRAWKDPAAEGNYQF